MAKSVQRYQLAVDEAKVRLNLPVCPGALLMPRNMVTNTEIVVGYNNQLKQATQGMKLGINDWVNNGGPSKVSPPNSHPSNPIHKETEAEAKKEPTPAATISG